MGEAMVRQDQQRRGDAAEAFLADLLRAKGFQVEDLNSPRRNHPVVDLRVAGATTRFGVSVKSCWSANRQIRLGKPHILEQLPDDAFMMILLPATKREAMVLDPAKYHLWIVPGHVKKDALDAHYHYAQHRPGSKNHSVMVKDKVDGSPITRSGAVFHDWQTRFRDAWHLVPLPPAN